MRALADSVDSALILSGSDHCLPLLIKADSQHAATIKRLTKVEHPLPSLDAKLTPLYIEGLTTLEQYHTFLDNRPRIKRALFDEQPDAELPLTKDIPKSRRVIETMHAVCGGRFRELNDFAQGQRDVVVAEDLALPRDFAQRRILGTLRERTARRWFDVFAPVEIPVHEIEEIVGGDAADALSCLQEKKLIARGRGGYRYYSPMIHQAIPLLD